MKQEDLFEQRDSFFLKPSDMVRGGLYLCLALGLVLIVVAMTAGEGTRAWGSILFNTFLFFTISLGGVAFAGMQDTIGAVWGRPIMRLHEGFVGYIPIASVIFLVFFACIHFGLAGADEVYVWISDPDMLDHFWGKKTWLIPSSMYVRDALALLVIFLLSRWQIGLKLKRDHAFLAGNKDEAKRLGEDAKNKLRHWSAPVLLIYALMFTLLTFDLTMSLAPTWFSTLWGGWNFAIMMQCLMATMLVIMFALKSTPIGKVIGRQQYHDVGKLMHGFTIFWAYLTYAHILTYWYGNVPEETEYFLHRMHAPWIYLVVAAPILCFIIPLFALIPQASKWTKAITLPICVAILFAQWLVALIVVMPEVMAAEDFGLPWVEAGGFFLSLALFLLAWFRFGKKNPMVAIGDPLLPEAYADH